MTGLGWAVVIIGGAFAFALIYIAFAVYRNQSSQMFHNVNHTANYLERSVKDAERERRAWMRYAWLLVDLLRKTCPDCPIPPPPIGNGHGVATREDAEPLTPERRQRLREVLSERLGMDELRDIAFDVGFVGYENFNSLGELARRLVEYVDARRQADYLIARLKAKRPDITL